VAYGCTTCIGNSGPLEERIEKAIQQYDLVAASVLSGNRNFEARIHSAVKANFLMSPPFVVAFAIAGRVNIDLNKEPLGAGHDGKPVYLKDIWPTSEEIQREIHKCLQPQMFKERYAHILEDNPVWHKIQTTPSAQYHWSEKSTYIQKPPYFETFTAALPKPPVLKEMRALALFGDSVTTDHISPAGAFSAATPAGKYLLSLGVKEDDFNSYGSRRGNHHVMMRGTFANVRLKNHLAGGKEGGYTKLPDGTITSIFEASERYLKTKTPLIIFAGKDYGMGSSRDWAAKGTALLGVRVVVARSFERIHRSNLIGMGVLPLEFKEGASWESLKITGDEIFALEELALAPHQDVILTIGKGRTVPLTLRLDTPIEVEYYKHGGIMQYVLRQIIKTSR
jgi:aconitate hydratase